MKGYSLVYVHITRMHIHMGNVQINMTPCSPPHRTLAISSVLTSDTPLSSAPGTPNLDIR